MYGKLPEYVLKTYHMAPEFKMPDYRTGQEKRRARRKNARDTKKVKKA